MIMSSLTTKAILAVPAMLIILADVATAPDATKLLDKLDGNHMVMAVVVTTFCALLLQLQKRQDSQRDKDRTALGGIEVALNINTGVLMRLHNGTCKPGYPERTIRRFEANQEVRPDEVRLEEV